MVALALAGLFVLGDSHAAALGPRLAGERYYSHVGVSAWALAKNWPGVPADAETVLVVLGTNDASAGVSPRNHADAMGAIVEYIRADAPGARIVWAGPPACTREDLRRSIPPIVEAEREQAARAGIEWFDSRKYTAGGVDAGGVHTTSAGADAWAEGCAAELAVPALAPVPALALAALALGVLALGIWLSVR